MDLGSILINSDNGSNSLLPIEIAERSSTAKSGNSFLASSWADQTEAPASETIAYSTSNLFSSIISATNFSDSLEAVPLPMAIILT